MEQKIHLIDRLHSMTNCDCMSDLKEPEFRGELLLAIKNVDVDEYDFSQWSSALSYYFQEEVHIHSKKDLQAFLKARSR